MILRCSSLDKSVLTMRNSWKILVFTMAILEAVGGYPLTFHSTCNLCPPGTYVKQECTSDADAICRTCDEGTFSDIRTDLKTCTTCSKCPEMTYIDTPCSSISDTVCSPCSSLNDRKSEYYVTSCQNAEVEGTRLDLHDVMMADDFEVTNIPQDDFGDRKGTDVSVNDHVEDGEYNENDGENGNNTKRAESNKKKTPEISNGEGHENGDSKNIDKKESGTDGVKYAVKIDEAVDDHTKHDSHRHEEELQKREVGSETADGSSKDEVDTKNIVPKDENQPEGHINNFEVDNDADTNQNRLVTPTASVESQIHVSESSSVSTSRTDLAQVENSAKVSDSDSTDAQKEPIESPENKNSELQTVDLDETINDHNDASSTANTAVTDEAATVEEIADAEGAVSNETIISAPLIATEELSKLEDKVEENSTPFSPLVTIYEHFLEEGRLEAVKNNLNKDQNEEEKIEERDVLNSFTSASENENSTLPITKDIIIADDDTSSHYEDHVNGTDMEVVPAALAETSTGEVTSLDELTTATLDETSERKIDHLNENGLVGDADHPQHEQEIPSAGKTHQENIDEDSEDKKRAAIIMGVVIGGLTFFILIFFATRCLRRRGQGKEMKKVDKNTEVAAFEFRPINLVEADKEEPIAETTNGLYRRGPKVGPSSPHVHQEQEKLKLSGGDAAPETARLIPLVTVSPAQDDLAELPPAHEPLIKDVETLKYIDESTDDEYVATILNKIPYSRSSDSRLSNVVEETPPASPSVRQ